MKLSSFIQSVLGVAICSVLLLSPAYAQSPAVLYDLRCENLVDPLSIDTDTPRLSWKTNYTDKGNHQFAYQILAATDPNLLTEESADLWNSGKTKSSKSVLVDYRGKLNSDDYLVYWCVRVWDRNGKPSAWSQPARFGIGISPEEWAEEDYIGFPVGAGNPQSPILRTTVDITKPGKQHCFMSTPWDTTKFISMAKESVKRFFQQRYPKWINELCIVLTTSLHI